MFLFILVSKQCHYFACNARWFDHGGIMSTQATNITLTLLVTAQVREFLLNDVFVTEKKAYGESNSIVNGIYSFASINSAIGDDKTYTLH